MDKRLTFSVAGSGKTTRIVNSIDANCRTLILTYTHTNIYNIKKKVVQRFGCIPDTVRIYPFTSFLYSSCFRPLLHDITSERGITFKEPIRSSARQNEVGYYLNPNGFAYHCRMSLALTALDQINELFTRFERFYDHLFVDEVQDLASRDFDFITILGKSKLKIDLVGDFFQHTYDSSRDGNYNSALFDNKGIYLKRLLDAGYTLHHEQLTKSYRCSPTICEFVQEHLDIEIKSHRLDETNIVFIEDSNEAKKLLADDNIVKLFYNNHVTHNCFSRNWGECKGEDDYGSVCVILNKTTEELFHKQELRKMAHLSKNKLYVALTRARSNVYLISSKCIDNKVVRATTRTATQKSKEKHNGLH